MQAEKRSRNGSEPSPMGGCWRARLNTKCSKPSFKGAPTHWPSAVMQRKINSSGVSHLISEMANGEETRETIPPFLRVLESARSMCSVKKYIYAANLLTNNHSMEREKAMGKSPTPTPLLVVKKPRSSPNLIESQIRNMVEMRTVQKSGLPLNGMRN